MIVVMIYQFELVVSKFARLNDQMASVQLTSRKPAEQDVHQWRTSLASHVVDLLAKRKQTSKNSWNF